jgi:hypothetical protein
VITYYKSRFLSPPVVYVQHEGSWKSYAPGGRIQNNLGPLPSHILQNVEEVSHVEVEDLVREYSAEAGRLEAERRLPPPDWGIGGWLILPVIGLFVSCIGSLYLLFRGVIPILRSWDTFTSPDSSLYHPLLGPYFGFITFIDIAILVVSIFLLVLIFKRKRILPTIIIYAYTAFVFVTLVNFVAIVTFIYQFMAERGDTAEASSLVTQGIVDVVLRGIITCGIWIPYFLYSKRVRNTFDQPWNSKRAALSHTNPRAAILASLAAEASSPATAPDPAVPVGDADLSAGAAAENARPAEPPFEEVPQALVTGERPVSAPAPQSRILLVPLVAIMVIILGVVIGLGVWRSANPPRVANPVTVTTDANGNKLKHYSNAATGFSFDYPADWVLDSGRAPSSLPGFQVNVRDPQGARIDNEAVDGFMVVAYDSSTVEALPGLSELHSTVETNIQASAAAQGYEIITDVTDVTINGMPAVTVTCKVPMPSGEKFTAPMYYLIGADRLYFVMLSFTEDPSDNTKPKVEAILNSLHHQP